MARQDSNRTEKSRNASTERKNRKKSQRIESVQLEISFRKFAAEHNRKIASVSALSRLESTYGIGA